MNGADLGHSLRSRLRGQSTRRARREEGCALVGVFVGTGAPHPGGHCAVCVTFEALGGHAPTDRLRTRDPPRFRASCDADALQSFQAGT